MASVLGVRGKPNIGVNCTICHLASFLHSLQASKCSRSYLKIEILASFHFLQERLTYNTKLDERRCLLCCCCLHRGGEQSLRKPFILSVCAGWLRLRAAHLTSLRQVLPGGPAALLHGGPRHRRCHLLEGEPGAVIMHETVTGV